MTPSKTNTIPKPLNLWAVYGICLLLSAIFFFLFGGNSPVYTFNSENDFQWFMTMGNGLVHGKIPYRDLFEQKGPIVYFVYAFACLFPSPRIAILILEIICLSLFLFFAYRICQKRLNQFYCLIALVLLGFTIFTSWCNMRNASAVEEFCLPIFAYFLLCWLEFLTEKKHWNWVRSLCLGLCFGILLWVKYTLFYFMLVPMMIWFILSLRRRQYRTLLINALCIIAGVLIITAPILLFYALHHAIDDLFYVYFYINLTAYGTTEPLIILLSLGSFFTIGPVVLFFMLFGVIMFSIKHWRERSGWLLLIAFLVNLALLIYSSKRIIYYHGELFPYTILGVTYLLELIQLKLPLQQFKKSIYILFITACIILCIPCSILTYDIGRNKNEYAPLAIADVIHSYENDNEIKTTLFCYKIWDFGFYNAANIIPNNYYLAKNVFERDRFPEIYEYHEKSIADQTSNFVITERKVWEQEKDFLSQYYTQYKGNLSQEIYHYRKIQWFYYKNFEFVLLIKK